jgi:uncharacterized membrane protein YdjX (TVP38/TMEM64 family)
MNSKLKSMLWLFAYLLFVVVIWYFISAFLIDKEAVRDIVDRFGVFAPLGFMLLQIIQNVIAPIIHYPILLAGGFIFGPVLGLIYNWIGTSIGTMLIILITKKFGRPLVLRMVDKKIINKWDHVVKKLSPFGLFLIYDMPIFPDDEITYLVGLSDMPVKSMIFPIIWGKIGGASLSFMGDQTIAGMSATTVVWLGSAAIGCLYYLILKIIKTQKAKAIDLSNYKHPE